MCKGNGNASHLKSLNGIKTITLQSLFVETVLSFTVPLSTCSDNMTLRNELTSTLASLLIYHTSVLEGAP